MILFEGQDYSIYSQNGSLPKNIFNVIYSMYADTKSRIKFSVELANPFCPKEGSNRVF
jgi:hypothetical protein